MAVGYMTTFINSVCSVYCVLLVKILLFIFGELTYNGLLPIPQLVDQERIRSIGYFLSVVMSFDFYLVHWHCFMAVGRKEIWHVKTYRH